METKRVFAAIDISDEARKRVTSYMRSLRQNFETVPVRWEKPEKLHITIKFAGNIDNIELASFTDRVAAAAYETPPFIVTVVGTGAFTRRANRASVLWLGLASRAATGQQRMIEDLAGRIESAEGETAKRKLEPHLTIARIKNRIKARQLIERHLNAAFEPVTFEASQITIYESTLLPTGSIYTALSRHKFSAKH